LSEISPVAVPGASGATNPFFSSDGQSLGFFANDRLQRAPISGGSPVQLCDVSGLVMGASWSSDGTIVFAVRGAGLFRVSAEGGAPERLLESTDAAWPTILPDGNTVLFTVGGGLLVAVPIRGGVPSVVARRSDALGAAATSPQWEAEAKDAPRLGAGWLLQAQYLPSGHLLYGQGAGVVRAVAFDAASSVVRGSPETVFDPVFVAPGAGAVHFAASETGLVVYGPEDRRRELVWVDRTGRETSLGFDADPLRFVSLSPDGTQVALSLDSDVRNSDIWIYDVNQRTRRRFTSDQHNLRAVWTPDGTRLWFYRTGALASKALNGASAQDIALRTADNTPTSWSRDGRSLLFDVNSPAAARDIWRLSLEGPSVPRPLLASPFDEHYAKFSPNDRWAAFVSNESGREEVYVASVERLGDKIAVSSAGGTAPAWAHNGRELFFRQGRAVMSVAIDPARGLPLGRPTLLFDGDGYQGASGDVQFDVDPTDSRFLMLRVVDASAARQLVVVQNWVEELRRLVPTN
jgi:serine/threonine-protein kinase